MQATANVTKETTNWNRINWRDSNRVVRNLRQRIFRATRESNWKKVRSLRCLSEKDDTRLRMHPKKGWKWRQKRYFGSLNLHRRDRWVFGDKSLGAHILKFSWFNIERHTKRQRLIISR